MNSVRERKPQLVQSEINRWLTKCHVRYVRWRDLPAMCPDLPAVNYRDPSVLWTTNKLDAKFVAQANAEAIKKAMRAYRRAGINRSPAYSIERFADYVEAERAELLIEEYCSHRISMNAGVIPRRTIA